MRTLILLAVLLTCQCLAAAAEPALWSFDEIKENPREFAAGFTAGILLHETGHILVALSKGYRIEMQDLTLMYPRAVMSQSDRLQLASAGFQVQWLASETVLRLHEGREEKLGNLPAGIVCSHLAITAAYLLVLKNQPTSDIAGIAWATGLSRNEVAALIAIPAILDYYRLTGRHVPTWVPTLSASAKGVGIVSSWQF